MGSVTNVPLAGSSSVLKMEPEKQNTIGFETFSAKRLEPERGSLFQLWRDQFLSFQRHIFKNKAIRNIITRMTTFEIMKRS